ncbi:hypothetical protein P170DRAFT_212694 [Aspergillus steynii IBT 23096]|uniref:Azaphilone pigments biosynthesis cluster protein L N-terminal domain-containing protein n=1 Tax=Aspergillus steynii IBT 23096 TaxID=1392250 RepID=A0A2I2G6L7_9EURO|nr:uncharacterized protein P170DRAFT_212694 [Aspergillus steynii IBT 23096]PLB48521.1 hypothetical protein P170DRAFT_212694 [Aspergillus steynii IBT 23096]
MAAGLDAIGVAASIIQLADFGAQLSMKLYTFYHQVKNADERLKSLSSNVSLTCTVLKQLASNLEQDEQAQLYSHEAFDTARQVSADCDAIFKKIDSALDRFKDGLARSSLQRAAAKVGFVFMENDINILRSDLERLKTTMLLLLNVIMYAGQIRSRAESKTLKEQSDFIQALVAEKAASEIQFLTLNRVVENPTNKLFDDTDFRAGSVSDELKSYCSLVERILCEIGVIQSNLEPDQYGRVRDGILRLHSEEIVHCEQAHGWDVGQLLREGFAKFCHSSGDVNVFTPRVIYNNGAPSPMAKAAGYTLKCSTRPTSPFPAQKPRDKLLGRYSDNTLAGSGCALSSASASSEVPPELIPPFLPPLQGDEEESSTPLPSLKKALESTIPQARHDELPSDGNGLAEGNSVLLRHLEPNRPDIADFERDHPLVEHSRFSRKMNILRRFDQRHPGGNREISPRLEKAKSALSLLLEVEPRNEENKPALPFKE